MHDAVEGIEANRNGRPPVYRESYAQLAFQFALLGASDADLARAFRVSNRIIHEWKERQPSFLHALHKGKDEADAKIADALYHRALGYSHKDTYITQYRGRIITKEIVKHYPPDTAANKFWLTNRQPDHWRERVEYVPPAGDTARALREQMSEMDKATKGARKKEGKS